MRRIVIAIGTTLSGLVLLFAYPTSLNRTPSAPAPAAGSATGGSPAGGSPTERSPTAGSATAGAGPRTPPPAPAASAKTYDGAVAQTPYGPVQVRISVAAGAVTKSEATQLPSGNGRDDQINSYAVPVLNTEAVSSGSAKISMVSGATYTSNAYAQSLQSALDQAGL